MCGEWKTDSNLSFFYLALPWLLLPFPFPLLPLQSHSHGLNRWRTPNNQARTEWNVNSIPTILRLENVSPSIHPLPAVSRSLPFGLLPSVYPLPCHSPPDDWGIVNKDVADDDSRLLLPGQRNRSIGRRWNPRQSPSSSFPQVNLG